MDADEIIIKCNDIYEDFGQSYIKKWKTEKSGRRAIGYTPIYVPQEIFYAMDILPVGVFGGGDLIDIVVGDSYFQSYICHIARSIVDMGHSGILDQLDGMIFPFVCDVMRNMSSFWNTIFPDKYSYLFDQPQNFIKGIGGEYYKGIISEIVKDLGGNKLDKNKLIESMMLYGENRNLVRKLYEERSKRPWDIPITEAYLLLRAGSVMDVKEHNEMLKEYIDKIGQLNRQPEDNVRVVLWGAFCEQPPLSLLKVIEQSGCYVVADDFALALRQLENNIDVDEVTRDPVGYLVNSYLDHGINTPCRFEGDRNKLKDLVGIIRSTNAEGVVFAAPSFCDPALEEQPCYKEELDKKDIKHISFLYSEDTSQFSNIREQLGTFTDSIKIWG